MVAKSGHSSKNSEISNERRNQLHEVIRLSGMNLIIDDTDHPLIIKVASIQSARMQVYFIDNEDFFQRNPRSAMRMEMSMKIMTIVRSSMYAEYWKP